MLFFLNLLYRFAVAEFLSASGDLTRFSPLSLGSYDFRGVF